MSHDVFLQFQVMTFSLYERHALSLHYLDLCLVDSIFLPGLDGFKSKTQDLTVCNACKDTSFQYFLSTSVLSSNEAKSPLGNSNELPVCMILKIHILIVPSLILKISIFSYITILNILTF